MRDLRLQARHFRAFAEVCQQLTTYAHDGADGKQVAEQAVRLFADLGRCSNPLFNRGRFERACVPGNNVRARS